MFVKHVPSRIDNSNVTIDPRRIAVTGDIVAKFGRKFDLLIDSVNKKIGLKFKRDGYYELKSHGTARTCACNTPIILVTKMQLIGRLKRRFMPIDIMENGDTAILHTVRDMVVS
jgi:hypothetical protein